MKTLNLSIRGMTCASCVRRVERALATVDDLKVKRLDREGAVVEVDDDTAADDVVTVIQSAGYDASVGGAS